MDDFGLQVIINWNFNCWILKFGREISGTVKVVFKNLTVSLPHVYERWYLTEFPGLLLATLGSEEVDSRIFPHAMHSAKKGSKFIGVISSETQCLRASHTLKEGTAFHWSNRTLVADWCWGFFEAYLSFHLGTWNRTGNMFSSTIVVHVVAGYICTSKLEPKFAVVRANPEAHLGCFHSSPCRRNWKLLSTVWTVPSPSAEEEIERHKNGPTSMLLSPRQYRIFRATSSNLPWPKNTHIEGMLCTIDHIFAEFTSRWAQTNIFRIWRDRWALIGGWSGMNNTKGLH